MSSASNFAERFKGYTILDIATFQMQSCILEMLVWNKHVKKIFPMLVWIIFQMICVAHLSDGLCG